MANNMKNLIFRPKMITISELIPSDIDVNADDVKVFYEF
jgi:hypothetical protein